MNQNWDNSASKSEHHIDVDQPAFCNIILNALINTPKSLLSFTIQCHPQAFIMSDDHVEANVVHTLGNNDGNVPIADFVCVDEEAEVAVSVVRYHIVRDQPA